ncbi:intercellular trafficking and secretion [Vermiconidia calcicola]|uniref:Intercellular trafficking and secretion n=1 Tax=Vermiconidia calcicola TaxID=1690605 RepID=A0ACC3N2D9_9PEZI|nr:intercellular trafficking and secretion [Vermiconidia calcicola]
MEQAFGTSEDSPQSSGQRHPRSGDAVGAAFEQELMHSSNIWNNSDYSQQNALESQSKPSFDSASDISSFSSTHGSVVDLSSQADNDSDFEFIDNRLPQADGGAEEDVAYGGSSSALPYTRRMDAGGSNDYGDADWQQAGHDAAQQELAGPGAHGYLECTVDEPHREGEGTQNSYVSYLVTTNTDFKSFQSSHISARRRYTDFVFLYKTLAKEYPQCAVPPLPDKHNVSHVRGQGFTQEFMQRRAHSLRRFLKRLSLHPVLRRAAILTLFLESSDWNATMKTRPSRALSGSESANSSVLETWTDSFLNAFSKPHKHDKRFADVNDRATKLDNDLGTVSKTVARVAKREADLEADYAELAVQFQKLAALEPGVQDELNKFATSVQATSEGWKGLNEHTDQSYLGSLKDMEAYIFSVKSLLKTREQKQLDFEGLTDYLNKAAYERDTLASHGSAGATGFIRQKIEDVRGVDHEQSRRERQRKLEVQIARLQTEVEGAKKMSEAFDEEVVKEVQDFERIKAVEFRDTLTGLADANIGFFRNNIEIWERFIEDMEKEQRQRGET